jgi:hypothetical protein
MLKEYVADVFVLLFFGSFIIPFLIMIQIFLFDIFSGVTAIIPFLFGLSCGYVINKGHDSEFMKRTLITSLIISIVFFISLYFTFSVINELLAYLEQQFSSVEIQQNQNTSGIFTSILKVSKFDQYSQSIIPSVSIMAGAMVDAIFRKIFEKKKS